MMNEIKLTLADYRILQEMVNAKFSFLSKLPPTNNENRTKKMSELLTLSQKIDFICHDIMASEVKING